MAKRNTLNDLNDFLKDNEATTQPKDDSREAYVEDAPHTLIDVEVIEEEVNKKKTKVTTESIGTMTAKDIADYVHQLAEEQDKSFTDVWLEIIAEGAKKDPLLKVDTILQTLINIPLTSLSVTRDGFLTNLRVLFGRK